MRRVSGVVALVASLGLAGCGASPPSPSASESSMASPSDAAAPSRSPSKTETSGATVPPPSNNSRGRPATQLVVLRPVHDGKPANGFVATPQPGHNLSWCNGVSRGALSPGIYDCGSSADYGVACWRATLRATMYCLQNPFRQQLGQVPLTDTSLPGAPPPVVASPLGLVLDDGAHCMIRDGGSWPHLAGHPDWYGTYSCNAPNDQILWAPGATDGVNRTTRTWTVVSTGKSTTLVSHAVTVAYFAGN